MITYKQGFELVTQTHHFKTGKYNGQKVIRQCDELSLDWKCITVLYCSYSHFFISWSNSEMYSIINFSVYLFVPWFAIGERVTAETRQELLLLLSRMKLGQTGQVEICTQTEKKQWGGLEMYSTSGTRKISRKLRETSPRSSLLQSRSSSDTVVILWFGSGTSLCRQRGFPRSNLSESASSSSLSSSDSFTLQAVITFSTDSWCSSSS